MTGVLCCWSTGPAALPTPPSGQIPPVVLSPWTAVRNAASACGRAETGRSWAGLGWGGLGALKIRDWLTRAPSKLSIGLALFDPDHRAVSCTPSRTRPRTRSQAQRDSMLLALLLLQTGQCSPIGDCPACLRSPSPLGFLGEDMSCAALCAAKGLKLAHHASRTIAFSSPPAACGYDIAVSCRPPCPYSPCLYRLPCPSSDPVLHLKPLD